jgi:hypothetical protein
MMGGLGEEGVEGAEGAEGAPAEPNEEEEAAATEALRRRLAALSEDVEHLSGVARRTDENVRRLPREFKRAMRGR